VKLCAVEPMATGFAHSRTIVCIESRVTWKKSGKVTEETRYYLASQEEQARTPEGWIDLSRQHWGGVEIRNHWRRDATLGEDGTRTNQPRALANLALIRSVNLRLLAWRGLDAWLPEQTEQLNLHLANGLSLIQAPL